MDSFFDELYQKYHHDLFQFLFYMVRNKEHAEDLVQEVYIRVLKSYDGFEGRSSEKTWLFSIARNVVIDFFRKQRSWKRRFIDSFDWSSKQVKDEKPIPEEIAIQKEEIKRIYDFLSYCTLDQRTVIILRFLQGLSISETANVLSWSESKVKTTQHRSLKVLKRQLDLFYGKEKSNNEEVKAGQ